jgi:predicted N-acyltransferase
MSDSDNCDWNAFVEIHEDSTIFHTLEWKKVIEETFNFQSIYLLIKDTKNELVGISPSYLANTLLGKVIVSQPFFEYGGPLINDGFEGAYKYILEFYKTLVDTKKAKYVELRLLPGKVLYQQDEVNFAKQLKAYDFYIDIKGKDFEKDIWHGLYTKKSRVRNSVGKAVRSGLTVTESRDIDIYYQLYRTTVERLGSPPYPKTLFDNIEKYLGSSVRFTFTYLEKMPIAAMMSFPYKKRDLMVGLVSDETYQEYRANDLLYNEQIEYATKNGFDIVDFGRTRPDSYYERYKRKWGATRCDLYSYVYPPAAGKDVNPYTYYLMFSEITKKIPWILTRTGIGSYIIKQFP